MKKFIRFLMRHIPRKHLLRFSGAFSLFSSVLYYGNKVTCPVCGKSFRKFLPYGIKMRSQALCPNCLSLERHRLLWLYFKEKTAIFKEKYTVLHVAPEQCFLPRFKKLKQLNYQTADLESPLADIKLDIQRMPLADKSFDVVICNHVMEHVENDYKAMKEVWRILKPGGFAIMQVPLDYNREKTYEDPEITDPMEREKHFLQKDHLRLYGRDYPKRLRKAGFVVEEIDYLKEIDDNLKKQYRLPEEEIIYYITK